MRTRHAAGPTVVGDLRVLPHIEGPERGRRRDVLVHLPMGAVASGRRFPVLYMHDGQNLFDTREAPEGLVPASTAPVA